MIVRHREHTIEVRREACLAGYDLLYFTVTRDSDGYFCVDSYEDSGETVRDKIRQLRGLIDREAHAEDPWEEHAGSELLTPEEPS